MGKYLRPPSAQTPTTPAQVKVATRKAIIAEFPLEEQLNILSDAIANIGGGGPEFEAMHATITAERDKGKAEKAKLVKAVPETKTKTKSKQPAK